MSSCDSSNNNLTPNDGSWCHELSLFEEEDFSPKSYILNWLYTVEEEEETQWKSVVYQNFCPCVKKRQVYHRATNTKNELQVMIAKLQSLQQISAKEMIKSMISHYAVFIRTSQEVTDLEEAILKLRTLLLSRATVIRNLTSIEWAVPVASLKQSETVEGCDTGDDLGISKLEEDIKSLPDVFDVLFAERKVDLAVSVLEQGAGMVDEGSACATRERGFSVEAPRTAAAFLHIALLERRARIVDYLSDICRQPSVRGMELRDAISALDRLGEGTRAHTLLLVAHRRRLEHNMLGLRPSGTSYGGAFTAALSQMTFSAIAQAERDSLTVFGAVPAYASELVVWAQDVTEQYATQIKQHVLSSAAAAGGLQAAAECVQIAFGHCSLLEAQGLTMCNSLVKVFRSSVEQALEANLKRIDESVAALASADDWVLTSNPQTPLLHSKQTLSRANVKLSCSAHRFNAMAQDFMSGISPLVNMHLAGVALEALALRFNNYVDMLIKAVPDVTEVRKEQTARTETQQLSLLSNATALAYELLPYSAFKLLPVFKEPCFDGIRDGTYIKVVDKKLRFIPGLKDWQRKLQMMVKRLQDHICRYHVKLLLYSGDKNKSMLTPATYISLDLEGQNTSSLAQKTMPSLIFQSLFFRLSSIRKASKAMTFSNKEVVTLFLAQLLEVFVSYMDEDNFWSIIEDGPSRIGPIGLKQFVLDMQFMIQMASSSGCGSHLLYSLVPNLTSRVVHAFAATGADPESVLPSDKWFLEAARVAIDKLSKDWNERLIAQESLATFVVFQEPIGVEES